MAFPSLNRVPSETRSLSSLSLSDSDNAGASTPNTERSVLFDDAANAASTTPSDRYVLVVGGLGFIGSHTTLELLKEGMHLPEALFLDSVRAFFATRSDGSNIGLVPDDFMAGPSSNHAAKNFTAVYDRY